MIPVLFAAIPSLVKLAEEVFAKKEAEPDAEPQGPLKKAFVLEALGKLWDGLVNEGKVPRWVPRSVVMGLCAWIIDVVAAKFFPSGTPS